ncbi:MAG TPA: hypothetical protein VKR54_01710 [Candidatus Babeliales bacterium]|jgi:hypothetical protein|nr:hypothetical protein [Candidatus Babeliales bacterium]
MSIKLIQFIFFLSLWIPLSGMNLKQRDAVLSLLDKNYEITETTKTVRPIIQPLTIWAPRRSTIIANHTGYAFKHKNNEQVLINYQKIAPHMPDDLSILNPATKKAYQSIENATKKIAFEGDSNAQQLLTEHGISKLYPLFNDPHPYALELLAFTLNLQSHNSFIPTTGNNKQKLIDLRNDTTNPATSYIVGTILYLHATDDKQKNVRLDMLQRLHCPDHPEIEAFCQFLINYGDSTLSSEDAVKKFIQTIQSQKNISYILSKIANTPLCSTIITKLESALFKEDDPIVPDLHHFLAKLHYKCKNYPKADYFYKKHSNAYLKEKKANLDAFIASIGASKTFGKEEITYLSSLFPHIGNQLKKLEKTDPHISYNIGLLSQALIHNNPNMNVSEKSALILNALDHLAYAQKETPLNAEFHTLLSIIYDNDSVASLRQTKLALEHHSHSPHNVRDRELFNILDHAEKSNPELYYKLAPWTKNIIHVISNQPERIVPQKNYTSLSQCDSWDLFSQLLPYSEQSYITNKISCDDILYFMALAHKNNGNYDKAYEYINKLPQPLSDNTLLLKAQIYTAAHKTLSNAELKTVLNLFNNNKKPSFNKQEAILSLETSNNNNGMARYIKAVFILNNCDDEKLINHALKLLEENIQKNSSQKWPSQFELACAYMNYNSDEPEHSPILQKHVPCDIDKAITYLIDHNNNELLLKTLAAIFSGNCRYIINPDISKKYINWEKAIEYTTLLINNSKNNSNYLIHRASFYAELNNYEKALDDIERLLNIQDLPNTSSITKEYLLRSKIDVLINGTQNENTEDQLLECFKQIKTELNNGNFIITSPIIHERAAAYVKSKNMTPKAMEWCCLEAESQIEENNNFTGETTQEQKDFAHHLLSAAQMGNDNAKLIILPYMYTTNYFGCHDFAEPLLIEALNYTHEILCNPNVAAKTEKIKILIKLLSDFTKKGDAFAYYILCDYYKKNPKQLENTMLSSSKAKEQQHYIKLAKDLVGTIRRSCWDTFYAYATRYVNNPEKASLIEALATFTLGSMCLYSDDQRILTAGTFYLNTAGKPLYTTFKLPHYQTPTHTLLGIGYYNSALIQEKNTQKINLELLRKSAKLGWLQAAHKMAEIYIEQQKTGIIDVPVTPDDFFPVLAKNITMNYPGSKRSIALFAEYNLITEKIEKEKEPATDTMTFIPMNIISTEERLKLVRQYAHEKKMIKYIKYKESSKLFLTGAQLTTQDKIEEGIILLQQVSIKENHPHAYMLLARIYLGKEDYKLSEQALKKAFFYGLIKKTCNSKEKQFHSVDFLHLLFYCIASLTTEPCPSEIKSNLLSIIKSNLLSSGINIKDFCEIFQKTRTIDLSSIPEWNA